LVRRGGTGNSEAVPELGQRVEAKLIAVAGLPGWQHKHRCVHRRGDGRWRMGGAINSGSGNLTAFQS